MAQEIITFYEDETEQKSLFPTTTASAVKWDDTQTLPQKIIEVEQKARFYGIDTSKLLYFKNHSWEEVNYTATEDCFVLIQSNNGRIDNIYVDDVSIFTTGGSGSAWFDFFIPLKKDSHLLIQTAYTRVSIYGIK